jgi:hypothetical protein
VQDAVEVIPNTIHLSLNKMGKTEYQQKSKTPRAVIRKYSTLSRVKNE